MKISLKVARVRAGYTQKQVADATGYAQTTIGKWERGIIKIKYDSLKMLCALYGCDITQLDI